MPHRPRIRLLQVRLLQVLALSAFGAVALMHPAAGQNAPAKAPASSAPAQSNPAPGPAPSTGQGSSAGQASTPQLADTLEQRVLACAGCHGKQGEGNRLNEYYPRIAGKPPDYLFQQLVNFRDGRRGFPQMVYFVRYLSDDYLREIADHYSKLRPGFPTPIKPEATPQQLTRGEQLVRQGDAARGIPACESCHGRALSGMLPGIPGLIGLYPDYINSQLGAWSAGVRHAREPDCMRQIVSKLGPGDGAAVSAWLSAQPGTPTSLPAPESAQKLPLTCGSQQLLKVESVASGMQPARTGGGAPNDAAGNAKSRASADAAARGEYLAHVGDCVACHTERGDAQFAGGLAMPTPFGTLYTPNITPDPDNGIGKWTADDFWRALHEGRSRDGTLLYPAFPYTNYTRVRREDADAIYGYLRTLKPSKKKNRPPDMPFPYNQRTLLLGWRALFFEPGEFTPHPRETDEWNRGAYLVQGLGHCDACHTSRNFLGATEKDKAFGGGIIPMQDWYAPSLTSSREAGIGQWDIDSVVSLLRGGISRRGAVFGPMAQVVHDSLQHLTEQDTRAMAIYLKSLSEGSEPAAPLQVHPTEQQALAAYEAGARTYDTHCKTCHQPTGLGIPPAYPSLANNQAISMEFPVNAIKMVLFGGFPPETRDNPRPYGMPPFAYTLSDQEVANVLTYMRQSWGNRGTAVSAADVGKYRRVPTD